MPAVGSAHTQSPSLLPTAPPAYPDERKRIRINDSIWIDEIDDVCVVWVQGAPWHRFSASSKLDRRIVGANLVIARLAKSVDVARGLELNRDTLYRDRQRLLKGGIPELAAVRPGPRGPSKATLDVQGRARRYHRAGRSKREIGRILGLSEATVRSMLAGEPPVAAMPSQGTLSSDDDHWANQAAEAYDTSSDVEESTVGDAAPQQPAREEDAGTTEGQQTAEGVGHARSNEAEAQSDAETLAGSDGPCHARTEEEGNRDAEETPRGEPSLDSAFMPALPHPTTTSERDLDRTVERVLARFGDITEADVRYVSGERLPFVGGLLILPALVSAGFFAGLEEVYGSLKNGFYGLRHTVMTVVLMLVLRVNRAERLAGVSPTALGRLLGLDRAPEVKTLRRRLREIASQRKADKFIRWLARHAAKGDPEAVGFLYVDGHTRIYYGKRRVSKAYSTRKRLALPATTDYWVNDANGDPIFVVTGEVNQALTKQLLPILDELQRLIPGRRLTLIFDRGGWSPKLFKKIVEAGHDFITYRKGRQRPYPAKDFTDHRFTNGDEVISYKLRDGVARFGVGMQFRQIVRREDDGLQVAIVTSRRNVPAAELVFRLADRWRQENYFKYARDEFELDALDTYDVEPDDPTRAVPNPERKKLNKEIKTLRQELGKLEAEMGRAANANEESRRPTVRGLKIANGQLRKQIADLQAEVETLTEHRRALPARIPIAKLAADEAVVLAVEHKHFMNASKMAVYRAESALLRLLAPHYKRNDEEGRALLREAFRSSGSLRVADGVLHVTLDPLSAPRRTRAIAALCEELTQSAIRIPGTTLRLTFAVSRETGVSELAMGPCQEV